MFATKERIEIYKTLKDINKKSEDKKELLNSTKDLEERSKLLLEINELSADENYELFQFYTLENENDDKMCHHIFMNYGDYKYWCPNCNEYFIRYNNGIYNEKAFLKDKDDATNFAGIPKLDIKDEISYIQLLYLRAYIENMNNPVINLRILENSMLDLYKKDNEYQKYIDQKIDEKDMNSAIIMDYKKRFGFY